MLLERNQTNLSSSKTLPMINHRQEWVEGQIFGSSIQWREVEGGCCVRGRGGRAVKGEMRERGRERTRERERENVRGSGSKIN